MYELLFYNKSNLNKLWKNLDESGLDLELKRQLLHDKIIYKICDNNFILSPIKNIDLVINLGSGYGSWSHFFNSLNNVFCIINIDIENYYPIFCEKCIDYNVPEPIIEFKEIDLKKEFINFKNNSVDFIYQRDMLSVYNVSEWSNILNDIYKTLKVNSYLELVEYDFVIKHDNLLNNKYTKKINNYLIDNFKKNNYIHDINLLIDIIRKVFKKKINIKVTKLPLYPNSIFNDECIEVLMIGYEYFKDEIENIFNIEYKNFVNNIKEEWITNRSYLSLYIIYVKK